MFERDEAARAFYHSGAWKRTRCAFLDSKHHICEICGGVGDLVHHKTYVTPQNVHDPSVTLSWDNLQCVCQACHNRLHFADGGAYRVTRKGLDFDSRGDLVEVPDDVS